MSIFHPVCWVCLLASLVAVQAKEGRTCRIAYPGAPANAPAKLHLFDGTSSRLVELPRSNFSQVYTLPAGKLRLRMLPEAAGKPEEANPDAPGATVPALATEIYLLVTSDPGNKIAPVKLEVIDATGLKAGQMLWCNLTPDRIDGRIGTEKLELGGNSRVVLAPPALRNGDFKVSMTFRKPNDEVIYPLCETVWRHDIQTRSVYFVIAKDGHRTPRVMGLPVPGPGGR